MRKILFAALLLSSVNAKAIVIDVPYFWFYEFSGECILNCDTPDVFGNPIASVGANFSLQLLQVYGLPTSWQGYDLTSGSYTFLHDINGIGTNLAGMDVQSSGFFLRGFSSASDSIASGPSFFGISTAGGITLNDEGVPSGVVTGMNIDSTFGIDTETFYEISSVPNFPSTFNLRYEQFNNGKFVSETLQGIGNWSRESFGGVEIQVNNSVAVPEPTTMGLMGLGIMGLVATRRKKKL